MSLSPVSRRLLPLYIAALLQSIPFWYAIEKLFMTSIGFNTASIGLMVGIMGAVIIITETPSGVLADRWSRKGVMILGVIFLLLSGFIGGISHNEFMYIASTMLWGVYSALYSGTYDSVIYDVTLEEEGSSKNFERHLGKLRIVEGSGFIIGALGGGWIASALSMRSTFFISLPFLLLAFGFLAWFKEPLLHKAEVSDPVFKHIRQTFAAVLRNKILLPVVVSAVGFAILMDTIFELNQLWFIALATPVALYGVIGATIFSTWTIGGFLARWQRKRTLLLLSGISIVVGFLSMVYIRNYWVILAALFMLGALLVGLNVVLTRMLHDELPSKLRAGSASVVSTLGGCLVIPGSLLFTGIAENRDIFLATWLLVAIALIATASLFFTLRTTKN